MYSGTKDWIVCDSSTILNYFYFRSFFGDKLGRKDIAVINHIQKEILKTLDQWYKIYYVPPIQSQDIEDGIRFHDQNEIKKLDGIIKSYLDMEKIEYVDLSEISIEKRSDYIIKDLSLK